MTNKQNDNYAEHIGRVNPDFVFGDRNEIINEGYDDADYDELEERGVL